MAQADQTTVIQSFQSAARPHTAHLHLVAMGIDVWIEKDDCGGAYPQLQLSNGVHLLVRNIDAEKAFEILQSVEEEETPEAAAEIAPGANRKRPWRVFLGGVLAGVMTYQQRQEDHPTTEVSFDNDGDGVTDVIHFIEKGQLTEIHEDRNGDGRPDVWTDYAGPYQFQIHYDTDFDGRRDANFYFQGGIVTRADWHSGDTDRVERRVIYKNGTRSEQHLDTDQDGQFDLTITLDPFERETGRKAYAGIEE